MRRIIVIQHVAHEGPGILGELAAVWGIELELVRAWRDPIPAALGDASGLVVLGGPMHAHDVAQHPHLAAETALLRDATRAGAPVLGICLGSQLLAAAFGVEVVRGAGRELGFAPVELAPAAADDPLFAGVIESFAPLHWHDDAFALPADATWLASSRVTPVQAFHVAPRAWGLLFHLELTAADVRAWLAHDAMAPDALGDLDAACAEVEPIARAVFDRWLDQLEP